MTDQELLSNPEELGNHLMKLREKIIAMLTNNYSLPQDNAEDIYSESCYALFKNIKEKKLVTLTAKLSTYFTQICINQALKNKRDTRPTEEYDSNNIKYLVELDNDYTVRQQQAMENIIRTLPAPCNDILWAYYYDNQSMADIAQIIHFSNADSVKAKKFQCISKLRTTYKKKIKDLMYGTN